MEVFEFIHGLRLSDIPGVVRDQARRCVLDLTAIAVAGSRTRMSRIMREHAVHHYASGSEAVRVLMDGRPASPVGAALAGAATLDSLDGHDGHDLAKGHVGAAVFPALLAFTDSDRQISGAEFLTRLVIGYEIGIRAAIALHTVAPDYHASGAWNALACAAVGARSRGLCPEQSAHAIGIAEYSGPRGPMLRCIDHPAMVKDASAWGAAAGVSATLLAASGFTGAPADTLSTDRPGIRQLWADLGTRWRILDQYLKPYPVCRWAHPAIEAAVGLVTAHRLSAGDVRGIDVTTFHPATRLAVTDPGTTEEAQYSLPFTLAVAVTHGTVEPTHLCDGVLDDPELLRLSAATVLRERADFSTRFPQERTARVTFRLTDGRSVESPVTTARGGPRRPLSDIEIHRKYRSYTEPVVGRERSRALAGLIAQLPGQLRVGEILDILLVDPCDTL